MSEICAENAFFVNLFQQMRPITGDSLRNSEAEDDTDR